MSLLVDLHSFSVGLYHVRHWLLRHTICIRAANEAICDERQSGRTDWQAGVMEALSCSLDATVANTANHPTHCVTATITPSVWRV